MIITSTGAWAGSDNHKYWGVGLGAYLPAGFRARAPGKGFVLKGLSDHFLSPIFYLLLLIDWIKTGKKCFFCGVLGQRSRRWYNFVSLSV